MPDSDHQLDRLVGKFIVLDGPDGCGKTTQQALLAKRLETMGLGVVTCRDPGGTAVGDRIRSVLLDHDLNGMDARCETLLFMASRAQLCAEVIRPAIAAGKTVVCDRFVSATCAYQGAAGFDVASVVELAQLAIGDCWPDLTVILDVGVKEGFERIAQRSGDRHDANVPAISTTTQSPRHKLDAMESRPLAFHHEVARRFNEIQDLYPARVVHVDGLGDPGTVHERIFALLLSCPFLT